jgi:hypothetical protein
VVHELHKIKLLDECVIVMDNDVPGFPDEKEAVEPKKPESDVATGVNIEVDI